MSSQDRRPYLTASVLDQDFLNAAHDNLENRLEMIAEIENPAGGTIRVSDRNKYVGQFFYQARTNFPTIKRTVGDWLSAELEFSDLELEVNNADGEYNSLMPSGADFAGWIGRTVEVKLGLSNIASTYTSIFSGTITDVAGFKRGIKSFTVVSRDKFDKVNVEFPKETFTGTSYPDIGDNAGAVVPVIYGDWTTDVSAMGSIPTVIVNKADTDLEAGIVKVQLVISANDLSFFDTSQVYLKRGDNTFVFDAGDIVDIASGNRGFSIRQSGTAPAGTTLVDGDLYTYVDGDQFWVRVRGKDLGAYDDNIVEQARDVLKTYAGLTSSDFDASWDTYRDKAAPTESAISAIKSRIWIQEPESVIQFALSLLEQVRLEAFVDRDLNLKINSLHLDDFEANPSFKVTNFDLERESFTPQLDERNNFNRAQAVYNRLPDVNENNSKTSVFRNQQAIDQAGGKEVSKRIVFPNLYERTNVENQVKEMLKLASGYFEHITVNLTWRSLLLDVGDFVKLNVQIGASQFVDVPCMIREIGYDPQGIKIPVKLWSFQMVPFPGYSPGYAGITGGSTATITEET